MSEILDFDPIALREKYRHERDRRLRPDANDQYVEVAADFRHYIDDPHVEPGFTRKPLTDAVDVVIVGGGFGGFLAAARLHESGVNDIRIIEKGGDFGGPGTGIDIQVHSATSKVTSTCRCWKRQVTFPRKSTVSATRSVRMRVGLARSSICIAWPAFRLRSARSAGCRMKTDG